MGMSFGEDIEKGYRERSKENVMRDKAWQTAFGSSDEEFAKLASEAGLTEGETGAITEGRAEMGTNWRTWLDEKHRSHPREKVAGALFDQAKLEQKSKGKGHAADREGEGDISLNQTLEQMRRYAPGLAKIEDHLRKVREGGSE